MLSWPLDFKLYIALLLLPVLSVGFLASDALALGETYKMQNGAIVISGGNAQSVSGSSISLPPTNDPGVFGWTQQSGSTVAVSERYCLDATARLTVYVNPQSNTVLSVEFSCADPARAGNSFNSLTAWSTNVSYSTTPGSPPPGDSGGGIDISGLPVHTFSNPTGSAIRACDGIYNQFSGNGCIDYTAVANEDGRITYRATVNSILASCGSGNARQSIFKIQLVEPRTLTNDRLAADFTVEQRSTCPGMNYNGWDSAQARRINIVGANQLTDMLSNEVESEAEAGSGTTSSCSVEGGLGWLLCPMMNTIATLNDWAFTVIQYFLKTPPLVVFDSNGNMNLDSNGIYQAWSYVRSLANVMLVLVFLIIIFSQITSMGISNYGIKKMLPKLIVGAILINVSFWLAALAIDASNVVGASIYNVLTSLDGGTITTADANPGGAGPSGPQTFVAVTTLVLAGGAIAVMAGMTVLLPLAVSALVLFVSLVFVLTFRHAMVFILIVAAPVALVAYMLPNTEGIFKTWFKLLRVLLYIYPAIAFIMGISTIAASLTFAAANQNEDLIARNIMRMIAVAMPAMGIFAGIMLAKTMGSVLGKLGVTNPFSGAINSAKDRAGKFGERRDKGLSARASRGGRFRRNAFGNIGGHKGKMMRDMKNETSNANFEAAMLGTAAGQNNFRSRGAAQQTLNSARSKADLDEITYNKPLHINAEIDKLGVDTVKQDLGDDIAREITSNNAAALVAGGGVAGGDVRAQASAQARLEKREEEEVHNARTQYERSGRDSNWAMNELSSGNATTPAQRKALRNMAVEAGDAAHIEELWNQSSTWDQAERNSFAASLAKNKPAGVGMGAIAGMRSGSGGQFKDVLADAAVAGAYSPKSIAGADKSEVEMLANVLGDTARVQAAIARSSNTSRTTVEIKTGVKQASATAISDPDLGAGKNRDALTYIRDVV